MGLYISGTNGGVSSVTGTAPVASSGGNTPAISMPAATTSVSGYLTNTDWNTFNGKQAAGSYLTSAVTSVSGTGTVSGLTLSGTVTSSGNLTLGGTLSLTSGNVTTALGYTPYNSTNPNGYITSSGSISGNAATATNLLNTGTTTLATATESNSIYITAPSYTTDSPVKLLNFDWYGNVFSIGNIRSGATPSNGFGVFYTASGGSITEIARFGTDSSLNIVGAVKQNGSQVLHAGNYNSYSPTLTGTGASGTWGISITGNAANITGTYAGTISSSQITTGLGFTPYNATNPSSFIALSSAITGYTAGTNTALAATDTLLAALGKIQGQITATSGTVTSVGGTGTVAGLSLSGTVTSTGNLTLSGTLSTPVSTINDSTTVGRNLVKLTNPTAITFLRINADNTVSTLDAATFRSAIGAGTSSTTGTVTSVTGTAPVVSSGGTAPAISMAAATASVNGYMTSTYAAKLDGIAAGATANTGTVTSVTGTAPVVSSGGTAPAISMAAANSTTNGYMTSTYAAKLDGIAAGATAGGLGGQQVFTGNGTFTIPTGVTKVKVTVVGGGGGGAGSQNAGNMAGGCGAGGGAAITFLSSLTPGNTISVTVGAAGTAGSANNVGGAGGTSQIASGTQTITTVSATGGGGGLLPGNTLTSVGGIGSNGSMNIRGGSGGRFGASPGGSSILGGGSSYSTSTGTAGGAYGGGGSGGSTTTDGCSTSYYGGGAGAAGVVIFEW